MLSCLLTRTFFSGFHFTSRVLSIPSILLLVSCFLLTALPMTYFLLKQSLEFFTLFLLESDLLCSLLMSMVPSLLSPYRPQPVPHSSFS